MCTEQLDTAQHDLVTARTTALSDHEILRTELQRSKAIAADLKLAHRLVGIYVFLSLCSLTVLLVIIPV